MEKPEWTFLDKPILCKSQTKQSRKGEPWEIQVCGLIPTVLSTWMPGRPPKSHIHSHSITLCRCKLMKAAPSNERWIHKVNVTGGTVRFPACSHSVRGNHRNMSETSETAQWLRNFALHFQIMCWTWERGVWDKTVVHVTYVWIVNTYEVS